MMSLSYEWGNACLPPPDLDLILTNDHHHHHYHNLNHDLSSLNYHHPMTIFPDSYSTPYTFPRHNPSALPYSSSAFSLYQPVQQQPPIETFTMYPEDLNRVGLVLGGRTYFSADYDLVSRLYCRSRAGAGEPKCQVEGCNADLSLAKSYHRRHKVCEVHSKAAAVFAAGLTQRFCQQCSRFHVLTEFDNGKRSCRKRLADHNRRRRKSHQSDHPASSELENAGSLGDSKSNSLASEIEDKVFN